MTDGSDVRGQFLVERIFLTGRVKLVHDVTGEDSGINGNNKKGEHKHFNMKELH